jgi:glycerophosphoryl diester phosphodiesterase
MVLLMALLTSHAGATVLTFEDYAGNNSDVNAIANPFGAGQYGSRAASAINPGFQIGDGWTPNVVLIWSAGWQTYTAWPFGNDAQTGAGKVAQADFSASGGNPLTLTFTPDAGFGVRVKSFAFTVWNASPQVPVQIQWTLFAGSLTPGNEIASGLTDAIGASGGAQTINTGMTNVLSSASPVLLRWQLISGDATYIAINNVHFTQAPARERPEVLWVRPDAILVGTPLSAIQLDAMADIPGEFVYTPPSGTVLPPGTHTLAVDFKPTDTNTYETARETTLLLVKADNVPVIRTQPPLKIGTNDPLTLAMFVLMSDVRGSFSLSPPAGTLLALGTQTVSLFFTPDNPVFANVVTNIALTVVEIVPEGTIWTFANPANRLLPLCGDDVLVFHDPNGTGWFATNIAFGSASSFGLPVPAGGDPQVMRFSHSNATEGLKLGFNDPPNGVYQDNGWLANYTLVFDLLYPPAAAGARRPLYNASLQNANAAEALITSASPAAVTSIGRSYGEIHSNTWHRVTLVVRSAPAEGQIHIYVDGTFIGAIGSNDSLISTAFAFEDFFFLLTDNTGNRGTGYLSGLRFIGRNLDYAEVKALGGVHADGPHVAGPPAPRPPFQPLRDVVVIGHRGNGGLAPEDTLPSFLSCFALGGDVVEVDIRRTADNRVVVMHDGTVERTTDGTGSVSTMTLAQLQQFDAGSWFGPQFAGTPPPALREVMAAVKDPYPEAILYLDCKINGLAPLIRADCDATGFPAERLWFWVYDQTAEAAAFRSVFPNGKMIWGEGNWANGASIGTWPGLNASQRAAVVSGMMARGVYGFDFGDNEAVSLNPTTIQELRAAGFFVSLYSTLHPASMTRAINNIGIDGMETDFPGVLRELMPNYTATSSAAGVSSASANVTWTAFPGAPPITEIRVRAKRKSAPTWTAVATNLPSRARASLASGLTASTVHEFQPIGYAGGQPVAFGSVAQAPTLGVTASFTFAYTAWSNAHPPASTFTVDNDGDGVVNLVEYALDLDPLVAAPLPPVTTVALAAGQFSFRYQRRANTYVRWTYESSTDLSQWTALLELADYTEAVLPAPPGMELIEVTLTVPTNLPKTFLRLRAQPMP